MYLIKPIVVFPKKSKGERLVITGELKNKVDRLREMFWADGMTNPLDVIE